MQTERPLYDKEIKALKQDLERLDKRKSSQLKLLVYWVLLAAIVGSIVYFRLDKASELYLLIGTVLVYVLIGVWSFAEALLKQKRERANIEFALATNTVKSLKVTTTDYIELSELEDEGVHYLFQLGDNKILSLGGQDFYPNKHFPSDNFEIAICYGKKGEILFLEQYNYGKKVLPNRKIKGQQKWDLMGSSNYPAPDSFTVIDGQLEDIESIIQGNRFSAPQKPL